MPSGYVLGVCFVVAASLAALFLMWGTANFAWVEENAHVENLQVVLLFAAAITLLWRSFGAPPVPRILSVGAGAISAMFLVRELDLRRTWVPRETAELFHEGGGKDMLILALAAFFVTFLLFHWPWIIPAMRGLLRRRAAAYIAPGTLLVIAAMFERLEKAYGTKLWVALEETTELNGYTLLLLAGLFLPFHDARSSANGQASERSSGY